MGLFDDISVGDRRGQVKLWSSQMYSYKKGSVVPELPEGPMDYSIVMREGGYVNVSKENKILSWTDEPQFTAVLDKYGSPFSEDSGYFFER